MNDGLRWHPVKDECLTGLEEGLAVRVMVRGTPVCFVKLNGTLHALEDKCPHQGQSFAGGRCAEGDLVCPHHRMRFDPVTGRHRHGMTHDVRVFPVDERGGDVRIGLPYAGFRLFGVRLW